MKQLTGKLGTWTLPHVHSWEERTHRYLMPRTPLVTNETRIATIGSCFAQELAASMDRFGLLGGMHPAGLYYNSRSIRQELERIYGNGGSLAAEPAWETEKGFIHPFKSYHHATLSREALDSWSDELDRKADVLFQAADIIVITLGLIETWVNPETGNTFRQIPHPEVFEDLGARFYRLTVGDIRSDLERIRTLIREHLDARIILTVSPVPLHSTMTPVDVRIANTESKSRIRSAVSEFVADHPDVHYFHSYELVTTAEKLSDYMKPDGRHLHRRAVDHIMHEFLQCFASPSLTIPEMDTSWLTDPASTRGIGSRFRELGLLRRLWSLVRSDRA